MSGVDVSWDGKPIGRVIRRFMLGAKSPGGLETNAVFDATPVVKPAGLNFPSMSVALDYLIDNR